MRNMKQMTIIGLILIMLLITSCAGGNGGITIYNKYQGQEGVTLNFRPDLPPSTIQDQDTIIVQAEIQNKGAYDLIEKQEVTEKDFPNILNWVYVELIYDPIFLELISGTERLRLPATVTGQNILYDIYRLEGKSETYPTGEKIIQTLATMRANVKSEANKNPTTEIKAGVCYPYRTEFTDSVCIDSDIEKIESNPICRLTPTKTYNGQGAPLIVKQLKTQQIVRTQSSVTQSSTPILNALGQLTGIEQGNVDTTIRYIEPEYSITFSTKQNARIFTYQGDTLTSVIEACNPIATGRNPNTQDPNQFNYKVTLGETELSCNSNMGEEVTYAKLVNGETTIKCKIPNNGVITGGQNYQTLINVQANYVVAESYEKTITINKE